MNELNNSKLESMIEYSKKSEEEQKIAEFKHNLRKQGLLPILKDGYLYVYKIKGSEKSYELAKYYRETMYDIYNVIVENNAKFKGDLIRSNYNPFFKNMLEYRISNKEEIWAKFNLNDEQKRNDFLKEKAKEIETSIPIDDTIFIKGYRKEEIDEVIERITDNYVTCIFKRPSKISEITSFICKYVDLDFIASMIYNYLYSEYKSFSVNKDYIEEKQIEIDNMEFADKEKKLSENEKIMLIKEIMDSLNIECIYTAKVDETSDFQIPGIVETKSKKLITEFATHNANILYNSDFSNIYQRVISSNSKILKYTSN